MTTTQNSTPTFTTEKARIETILKGLRSKFAQGTPDVEILSAVLRNGAGACNPETVEKFAKKAKRFSTADIMNHFSVGKYKVAGSLAVLRGAKKIEPNEPAQDALGYSRWVWVG